MALSSRPVERCRAHILPIGLLQEFISREQQSEEEKDSEEANEPNDAHREASEHILLQVELGQVQRFIIEVGECHGLSSIWECEDAVIIQGGVALTRSHTFLQLTYCGKLE